MRYFFYTLFLSSLLFTHTANAQTDNKPVTKKTITTDKKTGVSKITPNDNATGSNKDAKDNFTLGDFKDALDDYLLLIKNDSNNVTYNFRIGVCYLYTNIDKSKAIYFLEKATLSPKVEQKAWYELGKAYMLNYNFDDAITEFKKYIEVTKGKQSFEISAERMIEMCEEAKYQVAHPANATVECMGTEINSVSADYNPFVPADESFMVFTSKRAGNTGNLLDFDGYNTADVYISFQKYDKWSKAKGIGGAINTELVEETAGLSSDGNDLFVYEDNYSAMGQIQLSLRKGKTFQKPDFLGDNISYIKLVTSATISPDKKMLVFACDKNESAGGLDLYVSKKLPSGNWGPPENLGADVNTIYNEDNPCFSSDGKTLYFASQGHNSMGGYDLFKTNYDEKSETWSEPVNLGYPINTPDDDMTISLSKSGRHGYISSLRPSGHGNLDIYKVIFKDVDPAYMILSGTLVNKDSINIFKVVEKIPDTLQTDTTVANGADSKNKIKGKDTTITTVKNLKNKIKSKDTTSVFVKDAKNKFRSKDTTATADKDLKNKPVAKDTGAIKPKIKPEIKVNITVTDKTTLKPFGKFLPNKATGKFLIVLPPGEFEITINADGYEKYTESVKVFERAVNTEIAKDIILTHVDPD